MFSQIIFVIATTFAVMASASPVGKGKGGISDSCNTGGIYCCNDVQAASSGLQQAIGGLAGLQLGQITGKIGLTCNPIQALGGIGGNSCSSQPVCCEHNTFNGVIALGCNPVNVNL